MIGIRKTKAAAWLLGLVCVLCSSASPAQEKPDDALIQMVVDLLSDADRDMRAVGLQQVREEVPGEAATNTFAALLPKLKPGAQADLLEALGDRGDAAARPAVLKMLEAKEEPVRAAAVKAVGALGGAGDVALLAGKAATGSKLERGAARLSLVRLRGEEVNQAIVSVMTEGGPNVRVELLGVLAARGAKETLPTVIASAEGSEAPVRLAALDALRYLADEGHVATIIEILKAAKDDQSRRKAELALLVVCSRGGQACADAIIAGLAKADVPSRVALLRALARAGGPKALAEVVARLDDDQTVRDEAVRMLSIWPTREAMEPLQVFASGGDNRRYQVLAIRGLARLAGPQGDQPADLKTLSELMSSVKPLADKRLVLGALGGAATAEALAMALSNMDQSDLVKEAGAAAVRIAEKMEEGEGETLFGAMKKVFDGTKNRHTRARALGVLGGVATAESLDLVTSAMDEPALVEDACLAAVRIVERMKGGDADAVRAAIEKVLDGTKKKQVRQRAQKVLDSL